MGVAKLFCYDLIDADTYDYDVLYQKLQDLGGARIQESLWAVPFEGECFDLAKKLASYLHEQDRLYVLDYDTSNRYGHNLLNGNEVREISGGSSDVRPITGWGSKLTRK